MISKARSYCFRKDCGEAVQTQYLERWWEISMVCEVDNMADSESKLNSHIRLRIFRIATRPNIKETREQGVGCHHYSRYCTHHDKMHRLHPLQASSLPTLFETDSMNT